MARLVFVVFLAAMICAAYASDISGWNDEEECTANEVFHSCGTMCETNCAEPNERPCVRMCVPKCLCKEGYIRAHENGPCILRSEC